MWTFFSINTVSPSHLVFNCEYKSLFDPQWGIQSWECENIVFHAWLVEPKDGKGDSSVKTYV